ncbi:uncharacterized protein MELLADRAFT_58973 [Melampsora larici-populina 98AG31]|uniref:Uncharacterized protein n=1 Tax=Melampsora larici-populina (strain 98AG31 / pathotype 3-4-7) TaxID=747676 RepID=F4R6L7_MELLP|nr:uncharacterized protein MELLADRAFT_58973 [Melampsora larici-populina 98AG31]EGG11901.1 hypothetical protein MELLADRAFT_58973 [Melampsora larici-populina 98AG31]
MTFIKKNESKNEVAQKVREAQPDLFPDPFSKEPLSLDCQSIALRNPHPPEPSASANEIKVKDTEGVIKMKRSSSPGNQLPNKKRVVLGKSCLSKSALCSQLPGALDQGAIRVDGKVKRKASLSYTDQVIKIKAPKHLDLTRYTKGKDDHQFREASKEANLRPFDSTCSERGTTSGIVKVEVEDRKPFHNRQKSDTAPQSKPNPTTAPSINPSESAPHITQQASQQERLVSLTPEDTTQP